MDPSSRKSNKIRDIVRLQQILKKWKKLASSNSNNTVTNTSSSNSSSSSSSSTANKSIKFLKKTLSFSERERESSSSSSSSSSTAAPPKGYVAVCVGQELKRFVIPTEYLRHQVFGILLREAEEEFGFQQEGVLKFPCEVDMFQKILKMMEDKRSFSSPSLMLLQDQYQDQDHDHNEKSAGLIISLQGDYIDTHDHELTTHRPQMCR